MPIINLNKYYESQNHRITESQNHRITESQNHRQKIDYLDHKKFTSVKFNLFFMILILITNALFFSSCKKEISSSNFQSKTQNSNSKLSSVSVYNLISNPSDTSDLFTNLKLYNWGTELKSLFSTQSTYNQVISDLLSDNDNTMSFASLGLSTATPSFQYQGVTYIPYLWLYNGSLTIDEELNGYLCLSTEVDAETALGSNYDPNDYLENDDVIPGWLLDKDSQPSHIISYDEAESIENPILIICYYEEGSEPDNTPCTRKSEFNHPIDPDPQNKRYWVKYYNIDQRHDNSKHSEVSINCSLVINNTVENPNGINYKSALINKNDLDKWIYYSMPILWYTTSYSQDDTPQAIDVNDDVKILGVVYEYDWYRITRPLVHITSQIPGSTNYLDVKLKMKSTNDIYEYLYEQDLTNLNNGDYFVGSHVKILQDE